MTKRKPKYQNHSDTWLPVDVALPHMGNTYATQCWSEEVLVFSPGICRDFHYDTAILQQHSFESAPVWVTNRGEDITLYVKAWMSIPEFTP